MNFLDSQLCDFCYKPAAVDITATLHDGTTEGVILCRYHYDHQAKYLGAEKWAAQQVTEGIPPMANDKDPNSSKALSIFKKNGRDDTKDDFSAQQQRVDDIQARLQQIVNDPDFDDGYFADDTKRLEYERDRAKLPRQFLEEKLRLERLRKRSIEPEMAALQERRDLALKDEIAAGAAFQLAIEARCRIEGEMQLRGNEISKAQDAIAGATVGLEDPQALRQQFEQQVEAARRNRQRIAKLERSGLVIARHTWTMAVAFEKSASFRTRGVDMKVQTPGVFLEGDPRGTMQLIAKNTIITAEQLAAWQAMGGAELADHP